jgi:hypothetical protein
MSAILGALAPLRKEALQSRRGCEWKALCLPQDKKKKEKARKSYILGNRNAAPLNKSMIPPDQAG